MTAQSLAVRMATLGLLALAFSGAAGAAPEAGGVSPHASAAVQSPERPSACSVQIAESRIDYGAQTAGQLALGADGHLYFARRVVPVIVTCATSQPIALRLVAPRGPGGAPRFANGGAIAVMLSEARLDGRPALLVNQRDPATPERQLLLEAGDLVRFRGADARGDGYMLSVLLTVAPRLSAAEGRVRDMTPVEAHIALDLVAVD